MTVYQDYEQKNEDPTYCRGQQPPASRMLHHNPKPVGVQKYSGAIRPQRTKERCRTLLADPGAIPKYSRCRGLGSGHRGSGRLLFEAPQTMRVLDRKSTRLNSS